MDLEVFLIESAAWFVFVVLIVVLMSNRYDLSQFQLPWRRRDSSDD
jgi:hypothetical protein